MKKLLLALALSLATARLYAATLHASPSGSGTTCSHASPCNLGDILKGSTIAVAAGDTIVLHAGTYTPTPAKPFVAQNITGTATQKIVIKPELISGVPEIAKFDGVPDLSTGGPLGINNTIIGMWTGNSAMAQYIVFQDIWVMNSATNYRRADWGRVRVTAGSPIIEYVDGNAAQSIGFDVSPSANVAVTNGATATRVDWSSGTTFECNKQVDQVTVSTGSPTVTITVTSPTQPAFNTNWAGTVYINDEAYTISTVDSATQLTLTGNYLGGNSSTAKLAAPNANCGTWNGDDIIINGGTYKVASIQTTTRLTLQGAGYVGAPGTVAARLPHLYSSLNFTIDYYGTPFTMQVSYCQDDQHCTARTNSPRGSPSVYFTGFPPTGTAWQPRTLAGTGNMNSVFVGNNGGGLVNSWIYDDTVGTSINGSNGGNKDYYGNVVMYSGYPGPDRGYGHSFYGESTWNGGVAQPNIVKHNLFMRPFRLNGQLYGSTADVSYFKLRDNYWVAPGVTAWPNNPNDDWPATDGPTDASANLYLGAGSSPSSVSHGCPGAGGSTKTMYQTELTDNWTYAPGKRGFQLGGQKGSCDTTIQRNRFINGSGPTFLCVSGLYGVYAPVILGGTSSGDTTNFNVFMVPSFDNSGCPVQLTDAAFPWNTMLAAIPSSGPDVFNYNANEREVGRGMVMVDNQDSSPTTVIDLCQMGGFVNEKWKLFNWQEDHYSVATPIKRWDGGGAGETQISACPHNITVSTTISAADIRQPGFSKWDGTPYPKPPDLGPRVVGYILMPDYVAMSGSVSTPTPTFTPSNTNTPSITPSRTFTPTFTASQTFTPTVTPSQSPTQTNTLPPTATSTPTFTASQTPTRSPTPVGGGGGSAVVIQNCTTNSPAVLTADATQYPYQYSSSPTAHSGIITCQFTVPTDGNWFIFAKVSGFSGTSDAFYVDVNGDGAPNCAVDADTTCTNIFDTAEDKDPENACQTSTNRGTVHWQPVNRRNNLTSQCPGIGGRISFPLQAGILNTIKFRTRDADTRLYAIQASDDQNYEPSEPAPTPTPAIRSHPHRCNGKYGFHTHPYDGPHKHVPCPWR